MVDYTKNIPDPELYSEIKEETIDDGHITSPFDPGLIDIDTKQPTISNIIDQVNNHAQRTWL